MQAFHNDKQVQDKYLTRVKDHAAADEIIKGKYWEDGKGCAVGCTIHSGNHNDYETELGVPEWLARLEDTLFENLPNDLAKTWPVRFLEAINIGSNLEAIKVPFIVYILNENLKTLDSLKVEAKYKDIIAAIEQTKVATIQMIKAQESGDKTLIDAAARSASTAARSAADSAVYSAVYSAARSASTAARSASTAARSAADSAVYSAARSASTAAEAEAARAYSVAYSAARSASTAAEAARAYSVAYSAAFERYSDKLLELIKETK